MDAAIAVFGRQGFRQGSLKTVADEVGLTIQGLLHYFPTKEELLLAALDHRNELGREEFDEALAAGALAACRHILQRNVDNPGFMRLFVTLAAEATDPEHPAHQYFLARYEATHSMLAQQFRSDASQGRLAEGVDPGSVSVEVIALMDGLQLQALLRPDMDVVAEFERAVTPLRA